MLHFLPSPNYSRAMALPAKILDRVRSPLLTAAQALLDLGLPPCCVACGHSTTERSPKDRAFCERCEEELPILSSPVCQRCAAPVPVTNSETPANDCPACREEGWKFDNVIALGPYYGLLRHLILTAKKARGGLIAEALGQRLGRQEADRLASEQAACIVPVPMHWTRRMARGVNSADRLATGIARVTGLPVIHALRRTRRTAPQTAIAPSDRPANVRKAFGTRSRRITEGATVLLVDDILTTGSTCSAAARELKRAGAGRVVAVVAAKRLGGL